jgi:hypothetical protein
LARLWRTSQRLERLFDIFAHMSMLRSALDELRGDDLRSLSDEALAGHLDEIERAGRVLDFAS